MDHQPGGGEGGNGSKFSFFNNNISRWWTGGGSLRGPGFQEMEDQVVVDLGKVDQVTVLEQVIHPQSSPPQGNPGGSRTSNSWLCGGGGGGALAAGIAANGHKW